MPSLFTLSVYLTEIIKIFLNWDYDIELWQKTY
jgi:hypothetical protein